VRALQSLEASIETLVKVRRSCLVVSPLKVIEHILSLAHTHTRTHTHQATHEQVRALQSLEAYIKTLVKVRVSFVYSHVFMYSACPGIESILPLSIYLYFSY